MKLRLLIADDEELARAGLRKMLGTIPCCRGEILEAEDGSSLVELARRFRPQLLFIDVRMPGLNGLDAAAQIKAFNPDACVVVVTALDRFSLAQRAVNLGLDGYLLKPVIEDELRRTAAQCLARIERSSQEQAAPGETGPEGLLLPPPSIAAEEVFIRSLLRGRLASPVAASDSLVSSWEAGGAGPDLVRERLASFAYALEREARRYSGSGEEAGRGMLAKLAEADPRLFLEELILARSGPRAAEREDPALAIRDWLAETPTAELGLDGLADRLALSPSYASRLFREAMGRSFAPYIAELRLERALALAEAEGDIAVEELARRVGYSDPAYFSRLFRERTGLSPRDWARSRRG